jgi:pimeloyl-ACP methyl ester carboxylesterase
VVLCEGFDMDNTMFWEELYGLGNQQGLVETLREQGFDMVVLDFTESTDYIQRNGLLLATLLQQINSLLPEGESYPLIGASMGGLVSRYALTWLEQQGIDPRVRTFISFDSPQAGANIPLSLQHWLAFFADEAEEAAYFLTRLQTPAARQMLLAMAETPPNANPARIPCARPC